MTDRVTGVSSSEQTAQRSATGRRVSRARLLARAAPRDLGALVVLAAAVLEPSTRQFAVVNLSVQAVLFVVAGCLPARRTRVMAVADCAWSWGLVAIGVQALLFGDTASPVPAIVAACVCERSSLGLECWNTRTRRSKARGGAHRPHRVPQTPPAAGRGGPNVI